MLAPIDIGRFQTSLTTPEGWLDLGIVAACVAVAWAFDRRLEQRSRAAPQGTRARLHGSVGRIMFPLTALLLLIAARFLYRHAGHAPFFIDVAMPMLVALAAIRMLIYGMRRLFAKQAWLETSERAIAFTIWGGLVLYFVGVLPEIASELDNLVLPIGKSSVSLLTIGKGVIAIVVTLIVTLWLSGLLEERLLNATSLDTNIKALLAKFLRAALLVIGGLVALETIGFDLTLLTVFGGALGVGIGLGLQKLAANYIAGFTILLDRSIRLGDMITVDNRHGIVSRVTSRYVVVKSLDGVEAIVPNETLVTTTVLNHSYTAREVRMALSLQVACDTDLDLAMRLMVEAAAAEPRVFGEPRPPQAFLVSFADNGINLELGVWVRDPEQGQLNLKSAINRRIFDAFKAQGIEIPYPRRDVRLVGGAPAGAPAALAGTEAPPQVGP